MKKRTFIFTEEQIKKFIGENFASYLNKDDSGTGFNDDSLEKTYGEIKPEEDGNNKPLTTNKDANQKIPEFPWFRRSYNTLYENKIPKKCPECGSEIGLFIKGEPVYLCTNNKCNKYFGTKEFTITERNKMLQGKTFRLGKNTNKMIDDIATSNSNDKMLNNMSNDKDTCLATHYTRLNRLRKMKQEDPIRYKNINGEKLEKAISSKIDNAKQIGSALKDTEIKTSNLMNKKNNVNKGHHKDGSTITYYEKN